MSPSYTWDPWGPQQAAKPKYPSFTSHATEYLKIVGQIEDTPTHDINPRINRFLACLINILEHIR